MDSKLRSALDKVGAEAELIERTGARLAQEMRRGRRRARGPLRLAACAALLIALALGGRSLQLYLTPAWYIDMDVNPSVELALNRFGRVIRGSAYNEDGERILGEAGVRNLGYAEALDRLIGAMDSDGFLRQGELMAVTVQGYGADLLLPKVRHSIDAAVSARHLSVQTEVFPVAQDVKAAANGHHLSPAKYLAIAELQRVDPSATTDSCRDHSISELRQSAHDHAHGHAPQDAAASEPVATPPPSPQPTSGGDEHIQQREGHRRGAHH